MSITLFIYFYYEWIGCIFDPYQNKECMTPKDKAKELVDAMGVSISYLTNYTGGDDIPVYANQYAYRCAFVAIKEICNLDLRVGAYLETDPDKENYYSYWEDVIAEIEKM